MDNDYLKDVLFELDNYGITWALTKGELENDSNKRIH